jgi:hypothetical protein
MEWKRKKRPRVLRGALNPLIYARKSRPQQFWKLQKLPEKIDIQQILA